MKTLILTTIALSLAPQLSFAVKTDAKSADSPKTCSMRIGSDKFNSENSYSGTNGFCAATVVGPKTIATASHCLDDLRGAPGAFGDISTLNKSRSFNGAFNDSNHSQTLVIPNVSTSVYVSEAMSSSKNRKFYMNPPSKDKVEEHRALIKEDMVVIQLESEIQGYDPSVCPRLPTAADCGELQTLLNTATAEKPAPLSANFYRTKFKEVGDGLAKKTQYIPTDSVLTTKATMASVNTKSQFVKVKFAKDGKLMHIVTGDSGSGLIANLSNGPVLVAVQTGVFADDTEAVFSPLCPKITDAKWAQVVGTSAPQTAHSAPVNIPGQRASGSNQ